MDITRLRDEAAYRATLSAVSVMPSLAFWGALLVESGVTDSEISVEACQPDAPKMIEVDVTEGADGEGPRLTVSHGLAGGVRHVCGWQLIKLS